MNKLILLAFIALSMFSFSCKKQNTEPSKEKTLTLQPGTSAGSTAFVSYHQSYPSWAAANSYSNQNLAEELLISTTDEKGSLIKHRSYISFDLKDLPNDAVITSAKLTLYGVSSAKGFPEGNVGTKNLLLQKVTQFWNPANITWNEQPIVTEEGQIEIPAATTVFNYTVTDLDVTPLANTLSTTSPYKTISFGLRLKEEMATNTVIFASNRHSDQTKRPKLVITYKSNS